MKKFINPQLSKISGDWLQIFFAFSAVAIVFSFVFSITKAASKLNAIPEPKLLDINPTRVIGKRPTWRGALNAPYTLIEFADYQCGPCRHAGDRADFIVKSMPNKVRFSFRNYPLKRIHEFAYPAAIAAERARQNGKFWEVHDAIYSEQSKLSISVIDSILKNANIRDTVSKEQELESIKAVEDDVNVGDSCGLQGTPMFVLCSPDGKVFQLGTIDQLLTLVK